MPARAPAKPKVASKPIGEAGPSCANVEGGCAVGELFRVLGKTHVLDILHLFLQEPGPRRFVDVQNRLQMSPNTLSERLKELVEAGLLTRTAYNQIPPRVDYEATAKARDLQPVFASLLAWAQRHDLRPVPASTEHGAHA
jgi:DNA-binding HxlR family transcriptional regulator